MNVSMTRFVPVLAYALLPFVAVTVAACNSGGGLITGSTAAPAADSPDVFSNEHPLARPFAVAWTSARAQKCGFYFDPAKLRASYLAYEGQQSSPEHLAKAQQTYDATFNLIAQRLASNAEYCSDRKSAEIKVDLQRHLAGDFTPKLPPPKKADPCGFFGCAPKEEKWDPQKWWEDEAKKRMGR